MFLQGMQRIYLVECPVQFALSDKLASTINADIVHCEQDLRK